MTRGDAVVGFQKDVASGGTVDIRPSADEEWTIHNIYVGGAASLIRVYDDGTTQYEIPIDSVSSAGGWLNYVFHVTNSHFLRVKNDDSSSIHVAWDGVVTGPNV